MYIIMHNYIMNNINLSGTIFRQEEKQYKRNPNKNKYVENIPNKENIIDIQNDKSKLSLLDNNIYFFPPVPGLFILPGYLSLDEQKYWINESMTRYVCSPPYSNNITNLDKTLKTTEYKKEIRWASLGYSYSWDTLSYGDNTKTNFPINLENKIKEIVSKIDMVDKKKEGVIYENFKPEIAFINYYLLNSTMMAHQDKSEKTFDRPLISISLGCSAIFLIGTDNRNDKPYSFLLRSGDVIVMTGKSRLSYHSIPRIINDCPPIFIDDNANMKGVRININVRQVNI
jgi:alkylated DNA repair protein alkB homolog 1